MIFAGPKVKKEPFIVHTSASPEGILHVPTPSLGRSIKSLTKRPGNLSKLKSE